MADVSFVVVITCGILVLIQQSVVAEYASFDDLKNHFKDGIFRTSIAHELDQTVTLEMVVVISHIRNLLKTSESVDATLHLQEKWTDPRMTFNSSDADKHYPIMPADWDFIWNPETYVEPEWKAPDIHSQATRIFPNGTIFQSKRVNALIPCGIVEINLHQAIIKCKALIAAYAYTDQELHLKWRSYRPLRVVVNLESEIESPVRIESSDCTMRTIAGITQTCLVIEFFIEKSYQAAMLRVYVPSCLAVMVAYSSFFIHRNEVSARIKLGTLSLFTLFTEYIGLSLLIPEYLDVVAANVWLLSCIGFVWIAYLMYCIMHIVSRNEKKQAMLREKEQKEKAQQRSESERAMSVSVIHPDAAVTNGHTVGYNIVEKRPEYSPWPPKINSWKIEKWCRIWYGVAFLVFNLVFWSYFLTNSHVVHLSNIKE